MTIYLRLAISSVYAISTINNAIKRLNYSKGEIEINLNILKNERFLIIFKLNGKKFTLIILCSLFLTIINNVT